MGRYTVFMISIAILLTLLCLDPLVEAKVTVNSVTVTTDKTEYILGSEAIAKAQLDYTGSKKDLLGVNFTWHYPNGSIAKSDLNVMPDGSGAAYSSWWPDEIGSAFWVNAIYSGDETKFDETTFNVLFAPPSDQVSGIIGVNTTWALNQSPYLVIGDVFVESDITLTIEPGVVVEFLYDTILVINGTLIAQGSPENMITFTSNHSNPSPGDWDGIDFNFAESGSIISYSRIEYAYVGINIYESSPHIHHNLIRDVNRTGIQLYKSSSHIAYNTITGIVYQYASNKGISLLSDCDVTIEYNVISDVEEYGIKVMNSNPVIRENLISGSYYNIECTNSPAIIENNTLFDAIDGIRVVSCVGIYVLNNDILDCSKSGISSQWSSPILLNNIIHENHENGISIYKNTYATISGNTLKGNSKGMDIQYSDFLVINHNGIIDNSGYGLYAEDSYNLTLFGNRIEGNENGLYLRDSNNISFQRDNISNCQEKAIFLYNCSFIDIDSIDVSLTKIGLYLQSSSCIMSNSTFSKNQERDFYMILSSEMILINSSFDQNKILVSSECVIIVKNYLHILVQNQTYQPKPYVLVEIKDNDVAVSDQVTDINGRLGFILITDRIYLGSNTPSDNVTVINISDNPTIYVDNPREIDMAISHLEVFAPGNPLTITIDYPSNETMVFDTINISGSADTQDSENITVEISVDGGEWMRVNLTGDNWTLWWMELNTSTLSDGSHVILARISSQYFQKVESIKIRVDNHGNKPPILSITSHISNDTITGLVTLMGTALDYDGEIISIDVQVNGGEWIIANNLGGDWSNWSFEFDSAEYANGTHQIIVMAMDNSSESITFTLDLIFENEKDVDKTKEDSQSLLPLFAVIIPLVLCIIMFFIIRRIKDRELRERYSAEEKEPEVDPSEKG